MSAYRGKIRKSNLGYGIWKSENGIQGIQNECLRLSFALQLRKLKAAHTSGQNQEDEFGKRDMAERSMSLGE